MILGQKDTKMIKKGQKRIVYLAEEKTWIVMRAHICVILILQLYVDLCILYFLIIDELINNIFLALPYLSIKKSKRNNRNDVHKIINKPVQRSVVRSYTG